jgi:hypothetical protein
MTRLDRLDALVDQLLTATSQIGSAPAQQAAQNG